MNNAQAYLRRAGMKEIYGSHGILWTKEGFSTSCMYAIKPNGEILEVAFDSTGKVLCAGFISKSQQNMALSLRKDGAA